MSIAHSRASPGSCPSSAGRTTRCVKIAPAARTVEIWSSSLEPKWANSPLLLMLSSVASRPIDRPSRPSTDATLTAAWRIARRVLSPLTLRPSGTAGAVCSSDRSVRIVTHKVARSFVFVIQERSFVFLPPHPAPRKDPPHVPLRHRRRRAPRRPLPSSGRARARAAGSGRDPPRRRTGARSPHGRAAGRVSTAAALRGGAAARPALRPAAVLAVASASSFLVYLDATIVNVAFPDIRASFSGATLPGLSWILSAYGLVFAALLVPAGRYAD